MLASPLFRAAQGISGQIQDFLGLSKGKWACTRSIGAGAGPQGLNMDRYQSSGNAFRKAGIGSNNLYRP